MTKQSESKSLNIASRVFSFTVKKQLLREDSSKLSVKVSEISPKNLDAVVYLSDFPYPWLVGKPTNSALNYIVVENPLITPTLGGDYALEGSVLYTLELSGLTERWVERIISEGSKEPIGYSLRRLVCRRDYQTWMSKDTWLMPFYSESKGRRNKTK